jgi:hypothetical protein
MVDGVHAIAQLRQKAMEFAPVVAAANQPAPTHDGYCTGCKGKKTFEIAHEEKLKNGALLRKGTCPDCGRTVAAFAKGVTDAA